MGIILPENKNVHAKSRVLSVQSYVQGDGSIHYLHRSYPDNVLCPIITMFRIVNDPVKLEYFSLRHWKYHDAADVIECPHCRQKLPDPILSCRFAWLDDESSNWLAECPTCRGWSVVTG